MELAPTPVSDSAGEVVGLAESDPPGVLGAATVVGVLGLTVVGVTLWAATTVGLVVVVVVGATVVVVVGSAFLTALLASWWFACFAFLEASGWDGPDEQAASTRPATRSNEPALRAPTRRRRPPCCP